jgi:hypothetical protein
MTIFPVWIAPNRFLHLANNRRFQFNQRLLGGNKILNVAYVWPTTTRSPDLTFVAASKAETVRSLK